VKILMLSWEYPPLVTGGLGRHVAGLAPALARQGVQVHVLTPRENPPQVVQSLHPNLTVHWIDVAGMGVSTDIYARACAVNELMDARANKLWADVDGFDLIHAHDWLVGIAAIELKLSHKCPLIATIHATERGRWRTHILPNELSHKIDAVERNLTFEAWRVIACSQYMFNELGRLFSLPFDKLDMIPNGINMNAKLPLPPDERVVFKKQYVAADAPLIFSVGRLVYEKGHHILIKAMPRVLSAFPTAKLVLAGKGPLADHLHALAQDMGVADSIYFLGYITDAERNKFFAVADCAVFPSLYEPFGIVALEAMSLNCPVVASSVGGLAEVVRHNYTGTLVYPDDVDSVAWGITRALSEPDGVSAFAATAHKMVATKYSWDLAAVETRGVYQRVIAERAQARW